MWLFNKQDKTEKRSTIVGGMAGLFGLDMFGRESDPLKIATAYACIRLNSNALSQTPLHLYREIDGKKERVHSHQVLTLLERPRVNTTNFMWSSAMNTLLCGYGNGYSYVIREGGVTPSELIFVPSENVGIVETYSRKFPYYYSVSLNDGSNINVDPQDMLHYRNITTDGVSGISPITNHSLLFQTAASEEEFKKVFFDNASQISGVIESEDNLKEETVRLMRENFGTIYGGAKNAGKTAILGRGAKYKQIKPISPQDADLINSRKMTNEDIMKIYGVPPPMLGDVSATYANSEQLSLIYQEFTLSPLLINIQQELTLKLLTTEPDLYFEFVPDLSKMSTTRDKAETQAIYKREGIYSANEIRARNGHAPIAGGDEITLADNFSKVADGKGGDDAEK